LVVLTAAARARTAAANFMVQGSVYSEEVTNDAGEWKINFMRTKVISFCWMEHVRAIFLL
jgi:hypothetical protein